jgi:diguanylate cyclase (GGDEF)-like protein/PAS domain S-box-containing protein
MRTGFSLYRWFRDVSIARKLYVTVGAMALLIGVELFVLLFSLNTLSSLRAYVGGEGLWSKAQKDAVFHLHRYGVSRADTDYQLFEQFMRVPAGDAKTRRELLTGNRNMDVAREGFLEGRNHPDDIPGMISLFTNFSDISYIRKAINIWTDAEAMAMQLLPIAGALREQITSPNGSQSRIDELLASIYTINERLTTLEDEFSFTLGEGSRWLESVVLRLLFITALVVETTGLLLAVSVSRGMQKGLRDIIRAANRFSAGELGARATVLSRDEIGVVAGSFNEMANNLQMRVGELAELNQRLTHVVGERERAEKELREAFALLDWHVNNTPLAVIEWKQDYATGEPPRVFRWSGRAQTIFGWTDRDVLGRSAEEFRFIYEGDAKRAADAGRVLAEGLLPHNSISLRCYTKQRQVRHCQWYNSALHLKDSREITILSLVEDVTERVAAAEEVHRLAHYDSLTGLPNRVLLQDRLNQVLHGGRRYRQSVVVMMIGLDRFKNINDSLGHKTGDALLQAVAGRISGRLRESDTLARVGGDEFVLVQSVLAGPGSASIMAQTILELFTQPFAVQGNQLRIDTSIGITLFPADGANADRLLRNADLALRRAKREGRSQYRFYSRHMDLELKAALSLESGLRHAIDNGSLELLYQPTFALTDGSIQAVEALVRWPRPSGGPLSPASFIPLAEISGLIVPLGEWTLRTACQQAKAWTAAGMSLRFAVNVSAIQLRQPDFAALIERILADSGLGASALELEVTESVLLDPSSMVVITKALNEVGELGVALAIDNFGTGGSSLGYLKRFPFNRIKIDASFVRDIDAEADGDSKAIVRAIITLGHSLGKSITAEGVETQSQLSFLRANTCDEAQGRLLARPRAVGEIEQALYRRIRGHASPTLTEVRERGTHIGEAGAAEATIIHQVMELARTHSELSRMVMQLRDAGMSWREVKAAIEAEMKRGSPR